MNFEFEKKKLQSMMPDYIYELFQEYGVFLGGGAITSLFTNNPINDFDIYFQDEGSAIGVIEDVFTDNLGWFVHSTEKSASFVNKEMTYQLIHFKYFKTPEEVFSAFDYTVCMGLYDFKKEEFVLHDNFLKHNSQRILKFNPETVFPYISMLRIDKYKRKGYKISKPEFMKVLLTCSKLKINSYEELKNHVGGMYGDSFDKVFDDIDETFDVDEAIEKLNQVQIEYGEHATGITAPTTHAVDRVSLLDQLRRTPRNYVEFNGVDYIIFDNHYRSGEHKSFDKKVGLEELLPDKKLYKFVKYDFEHDKYVSFFDSHFQYKMGEVNRPRNNNFLYFVSKQGVRSAPHSHKQGSTLIEVDFEYDDIKSFDEREIRLTKCVPTRVVPREEYESWTQKAPSNLEL